MEAQNWLSVLLRVSLAGCVLWLQGCNKTALPPPDEVLGLPAPLPAAPQPPGIFTLVPTVAPAVIVPVLTPPPPQTPAILGAAPGPGMKPRLIVKNICPRLDIWIASSANVPAPRNVRIPPNGEYKYYVPDGGLSSTRFWPKIGCDSMGQKCTMGSSGGDGQDCPKIGCAPPVDSKFEASFGKSGVDCWKDNKGCDWWDTSAVDGYTLPYRVEISNCPKGKEIDCRGLSLAQCPTHEQLGETGVQDLQVIDPATKAVVGCYSPCGKLTYSNWDNPVGKHAPNSLAAEMYCCPTPPVSSEACRTGPVEHTSYVKLIHQYCPRVYGYAYDDAVGLQVCPSDTIYTWSIGCPMDPQEFVS